MLQEIQPTSERAEGARFAIVASKYNQRYVDGMLAAAQGVLEEAGAAEVLIVRVPGAFEIPAAASKLLGALPGLSAILCLGVILRGATAHAHHIGEAVSNALAQLQVLHGKPVIHEVLLLENEDQAEARCLGGKHNRGGEAAWTAVAMTQVMAAIETRAKDPVWAGSECGKTE